MFVPFYCFLTVFSSAERSPELLYLLSHRRFYPRLVRVPAQPVKMFRI
jgi:hypothetical protein